MRLRIYVLLRIDLYSHVPCIFHFSTALEVFSAYNVCAQVYTCYVCMYLFMSLYAVCKSYTEYFIVSTLDTPVIGMQAWQSISVLLDL